MSLTIVIAILALCILLEGFFSGAEMAVVNADKYRLAVRTDAKSKLALSALHLIKYPAIFFSTTLVGTNICTVTGSVIMAFYLISNYGEAYAPLAIIFWPFTLILGEVIPKSVYQHYADQLVLKVAPILLVVSWLLFPIVWPLSRLTNFLLGHVKSKVGTEPPLTREELELMLESGGGVSDVKASERTMVSCILDLADKKASDIMTPLIEVISISIESTREEATAVMERHSYSRVPVFQGNGSNIIGVLNGIDLLFTKDKTPLNKLIKDVYYVPETMPLDTLLINMKRHAQPLAVIVDEFGGSVGIVTLEDLLEEVVGEIRDEHDMVSAMFQRTGHNRYIVSGRMEVELANERMKLGIPPGEYKTIAGFLLEHTEKIPKVGENIVFNGYQYTITHTSRKAIMEVEVNKL